MFINFVFILSSVQCANILGVFLTPSLNHQMVHQPIWKELSLRGHQVTVVTPHPLKDATLTNLTEIEITFANNCGKMEVSNTGNVFSKLHRSIALVDSITEKGFDSSDFKELISDRNRQFDLILIESWYPVLYGLAARFEAPVIGVSTGGLWAPLHAIIGNPSHPVLYPETLLGYKIDQMTLWQKVVSAVFDMYYRLYHYYIFVPRSHQTATKYFGEIPYLGDLERNVSMLFFDKNPVLYKRRAYVPATVDIGFIHIKPIKPLPKDLQFFLDDTEYGAIYVGVDFPEKLRSKILATFLDLPYKVLWKCDQFLEKSEKIMTRKWLPDQDILAHKNIKAFVTDGSTQAVEEGIAGEVPMIGFPLTVEQFNNIQRIEEAEIGLGVDPDTVTKDELKEVVWEVVEQLKYRHNIKEIRNILFDEPMSGLERAVWWTEYVIRHKGAPHLRSPTADISWYRYLLLDVIIQGGPLAALYILMFKSIIEYLIYLFRTSNQEKQD